MSKRVGIGFAVVAVAAVVAWFAFRGEGAERTNAATEVAGERAETRAPVQRPEATPPVTVAGTVVSDSDGAPIEGAVVQLSGDGADELPPDALTARTGAGGAWTIQGVPAGRYAVAATAAGFLPAVIDEVDARRAVAGVVLSLRPGGNRLGGVVSDVSGGPIAGAVVRVTPVHGVLSVRGDRGFAALTDAEGRYELRVADGRYRAVAVHADYVASAAGVELRGGDRTLDFALAPGGAVEGVVVDDATGRPAPGARVAYSIERVMTVPGVGAMTVGGRGGVVVADGAGAFRVTGLEAGVVSLEARAAEGATREPTTVPLGIGEQAAGVELRISEALSIAGRVVIAGEDAPAVGVRVLALAPERGVGLAALQPTDALGRFAIDGLQPGRYRLIVDTDELLSDPMGTLVTVEDDVADVVLEVERGAMVRGRVEPAGVAEVGVQLGGGPDKLPGMGALRTITLGGTTTHTREDGTFELGPVKPGALTLVGKAADGRRGEASVDVGPGGADGVVIALEPRASVSGRVVDARGQAVANAIVSLRRATGNRRVTMVVNGRDLTAEQSPTHEDGTFVIRGLDAGDYELRVLDEQGQPLAWAKTRPAEAREPRKLALAENEDKTGVTLKVEARNGVIRGVARGPDGSPLPDVWVTATPAMKDFPMPPGGRAPRAEAADEEVVEESHFESRAMVMVSDDGGGDGGVGGLAFAGSAPPVLTGPDGRFEIRGLRDGEYDLMAEGLRGAARGFVRGAKTGDDVAIDLVALTRIDGVVTLDGQPVTQFRVELHGQTMRTDQIRDDAGRFTIHRVDPGAYTVRVVSDQGTGEANVTVEAGKAAKVDIALVGSVKVTGRVLDADGNPVAGAMVLVGQGTGGRVEIAMTGDEEPATTGADGRFTTTAGPGEHLLLVMNPDEHRPVVMQPFEVQGADVDLGTLQAGPQSQ